MNELHKQIDWAKGDGLVPAIVQHAISGRVLMLAYMNVDALTQTQSSGWVTFFSRSRQCLWTKGETSGNRLELNSIEVDCDGDTLVVNAIPSGPTCHLEKHSCFDDENERPGFGFIGQLESIIESRMSDRPNNSYTVQLLDAGTQRIAQKIGEEGVELALATSGGDSGAIVREAADLIFHTLLMLRHRGLQFADVVEQLKSRHDS